MTENELKKLNRKQLLELLLKQTERTEQLEMQLKEVEKKNQDKSILKREAGSIAEAALKLNGVFEAADAAVAQYIENVKNLSDKQNAINERIHAEYKKKADEMFAEARKRADAIVAEAEKNAGELLTETEKRCTEREIASEKKVKELSAKLYQMYQQKQTLDELFKDFSVEESNEK